MHEPIRSFLNLHEGPLETLPESLGPDWIAWEQVAKRIPELLASGKLRHQIEHELPELHFADIASCSQNVLERAYTIICFIAHAYIRGATNDFMIKRIPKKIAQVWVDVAEALDLPPISTYASTVTFNVRFSGIPTCLDDLSVFFNSIGLVDEEWFYVVSAGIDLESGSIINIVERLKAGDNVDDCLLELSEIINRLTVILERMYEKCDPYKFFHEIRRFFSGWLNDPQLDGKGLCYELERGDVYFNLAGGSAAQTATIQLIDILLSIKHEHQADTDTFLEGKLKLPYFKEMRSYMPLSHRSYLEECEVFFGQLQVKESIMNSVNYKACLAALSAFRNFHIIMVTRYIVSQKSKSKSSEPVFGTGGSNPIPFLKQFRNDTLERMNN